LRVAQNKLAQRARFLEAARMTQENVEDLGLRERKKLETREKLGWAAMHLAAERGLENVRVEDIATAAGVSPRTFNNYFSSRAAAICAVAGDRAKRVGLALLARPAEEPLNVALTEAVLEEYLHGREPDKSGARQMRMVAHHPELRGEFLKGMDSMETDLAAAIAERAGCDPDQDLYPLILAAAVTGAVRVATEKWLHPETETPYSALLRDAVSIAASIPARDILSENANP
jgi:AcrR family transcriptional regulator